MQEAKVNADAEIARLLGRNPTLRSSLTDPLGRPLLERDALGRSCVDPYADSYVDPYVGSYRHEYGVGVVSFDPLHQRRDT